VWFETGTLAAQGNIVVADAVDYNGSATLLINGAGPQSFTGSATQTSGGLPHVHINKPSGTLSLSGTLKATRDWTYTAGTIDAGTSTVVFGNNGGTVTITGSHTLANVTIDPNGSGSGSIINVTAGTTLTVSGTLTFDNSGTGWVVVGDTGTLAAQGNIVVADAVDYSGGATLLINGAGPQSFTGSATQTSGGLPHVHINKPGGTLSLSGTLKATRDWTYTAGTIDAGTSTVVLGECGGDHTVTGSHALNHVTIDSNCGSGSVLRVAGGTTLTVGGTLTLDNSSEGWMSLLGGAIAAQGHVTIDDRAYSSSTPSDATTILINGATDQTLTGSGGWLPSVTIDKAAGTLNLSGTIGVQDDWTYLQGAIAPGASVVTFDIVNSNTITGSHALGDVTFTSNTGFSPGIYIADGTVLTVAGTLNLNRVAGGPRILDVGAGTGTLAAQGDVTTSGTSLQVEVAFLLTGGNSQILNLASNTGVFWDPVTVNKTAGSVASLASSLVANQTGQDLTIQGGALNLAGNALTVNDALAVQNGGTLQLFGSETITRGSLDLQTGSTVTYTGNGNAGVNTYTITGTPPNLGATYHHLILNSTDGATDTFQLGAALDVNGDLTVTAGTFSVGAGNHAITVGGSWANTGTFNGGTGMVTFDTTTPSTITGTTTFYDFTAATPGKTLKFGTGQTFTMAVGGIFTVTGASGNLITIDSDSATSGAAGDRWIIKKLGNAAVTYANIADSGCDAGSDTIDVSDGSSTNGGNNGACWIFPASRVPRPPGSVGSPSIY
jgi:hypothetical protein